MWLLAELSMTSSEQLGSASLPSRLSEQLARRSSSENHWRLVWGGELAPKEQDDLGKIPLQAVMTMRSALRSGNR